MENSLYTKTYGFMFLGLLVSFLTGIFLFNNEELMFNIILNVNPLLIVLVPFGIALVMNIFVRKLSVTWLYILYFTYALLMGITIGSIFYVYELESIMSILLTTSIIFLVVSAFGRFTKIDLTKFRNILSIGIIVVLISSVLNYFVFKSEDFNIIINAVGALVITGYIAYDTQKVIAVSGTLGEEKGPIYSAFQLYLDFIILFIKLISLFGKRK